MGKTIFKIIAGIIVLGLFIAYCTPYASAQECTPGEGVDGPIATKHSAVKKPGDNTRITFEKPLFDASCDLLENETALTRTEFFASLNTPVDPLLGAVAVLDPSASFVDVSADGEKGDVIYYTFRFCNDFDCSVLTNQEFVKLPGRPKKGILTDVQ